MPLGFGIPNPGGMAENSPAFQFQRRDQVMRALSPEGTAEPRCLSRPFGTHSSPNLKPGVETPGWAILILSLRDTKRLTPITARGRLGRRFSPAVSTSQVNLVFID